MLIPEYNKEDGSSYKIIQKHPDATCLGLGTLKGTQKSKCEALHWGQCAF